MLYLVKNRKFISIVTLFSLFYIIFLSAMLPVAEAQAVRAGKVTFSQGSNTNSQGSNANSDKHNSQINNSTSTKSSAPKKSFWERFLDVLNPIVTVVGGVFAGSLAIQSLLGIANMTVHGIKNIGGLWDQLLKSIGLRKEPQAVSLSQVNIPDYEKFTLVSSLEKAGAYPEGMSAQEKLDCTFAVKTSGSENSYITCKELAEQGWAVENGRLVATDRPIYREQPQQQQPTTQWPQPMQNTGFGYTYEVYEVRNVDYRPNVITPDVTNILFRYEIWKIVYSAFGTEEHFVSTRIIEHPISWQQFQAYMGCTTNIYLPDVQFTDPSGTTVISRGYMLENVTVGSMVSQLGSGGGNANCGSFQNSGTGALGNNRTALQMGQTNNAPHLGGMPQTGGMPLQPGMNSTGTMPSLESGLVDLHDGLGRTLHSARTNLEQYDARFKQMANENMMNRAQSQQDYELRSQLYQNLGNYDYLGNCLQSMISDAGLTRSFSRTATELYQSIFQSDNEEIRRHLLEGCGDLETMLQNINRYQQQAGKSSNEVLWEGMIGK